MTGPPAITELHRTALSAAALRASHALAGSEPKIFVDDLALALCGMARDAAIELGQRVPAASATTCIVRSRYAEDRLAAARNRLNQYVVLGAGLDSFGLRTSDRLGDLAVYEVDDPPFQLWKRQRIAELGLAVPAGLHFVPCDFETTAIAASLAAAGFAAGAPCFVSWLGVTQYLTRDAIRETLAWAGTRPAGSEIVLSFQEAGEQAASMKGTMARNGVAVHSQFTVPDITGLLRQAGFTRIEHIGPAEAEALYFRGRTDGLRAPAIQRLVSARV